MTKTRDPYAAALDRLRMALLTGPDITATDRRVALIMAENINRAAFAQGGELATWQAEELIAAWADLDETAVRRSRKHLRQQGVVTYANIGGRGNAAQYSFRSEWIEAALAGMSERLDALAEKRRQRRAEKRRESRTKNRTKTHPFIDDGDAQRGAFQDLKGCVSVHKGVRFEPKRGAPLSPHLLEDLPEETPEDHPDRNCAAQATLLLPIEGKATSNGDGRKHWQPSKKRRTTYSPAFEDFWTQYPKAGQVAKQKTSKKFEAIVASGEATIEEIMAALAVYGASRKVADGYVCHTMTWLNEQRWTVTETPAATRTGGKPGALDALRRMVGEDQ